MKKLLFLILFFPLFSCNDWLQVESEVSVTYRNYFQSEQDLEKIYITMLGAEKKILAPIGLNVLDYAAQNCDYTPRSLQVFRTLDPNAFSTSNSETGAIGENSMDWKDYYLIIYLANMLEENRHRFVNVSEERADYWIAQANFLKGLMYFDIARRWGEAPIAPATEDASACAKSPVDSILACAIRAAEKALILPTHDKLTDSQGAKVYSRQYASIGSVRTLLANIYAWMGGLYDDEKYWKKAEEEASLVIDGKVGFYDLVSLNELVENTMGSKRDVTEVIHAIEVSEQDEERFWYGWFCKNYEGLDLLNYPYSTTDPTKIETDTKINRISTSYVEKLYPEKRDLRRKEFWYRLGDTIHIPVYDEELQKNTFEVFQPRYAYINKWREPVYSVNPSINASTPEGRFLILMDGNRIYWRLADLILLRAECRAHLGRADAVNDLNRIRERAGLMNYSGSTEKEALLREIFNERDRELFGETCRYFDIVRNGYYRDLLDGNYKTLTDEDVENGALYLPISKAAFNKNTLMKQNTYWSWHLK